MASSKMVFRAASVLLLVVPLTQAVTKTTKIQTPEQGFLHTEKTKTQCVKDASVPALQPHDTFEEDFPIEYRYRR